VKEPPRTSAKKKIQRRPHVWMVVKGDEKRRVVSVLVPIKHNVVSSRVGSPKAPST